MNAELQGKTTHRAIIILCLILGGILAVIGSFQALTALQHRRQMDREAKEQKAAQRDAVNQIIQAIAAIKVCTEGTTYDEFRQRELECETTYEINKPRLASFDTDLRRLIALLKALDLCWGFYSKDEMANGYGPLSPSWPGFLDAMKLIHPAITNKLNIPADWDKDPDFYCKNYVHWGLNKINIQCQVILGELQASH